MALTLNRQSLDSLLPSGVTLFINFGCPYKCSVYENELEKTSPFYFRSVGRNRDDILPPKYLYELERDYAWLTVMLRASFEKFQKLIRMACGVATIRRLTLSTLVFQEPT